MTNTFLAVVVVRVSNVLPTVDLLLQRPRGEMFLVIRSAEMLFAEPTDILPLVVVVAAAEMSLPEPTAEVSLAEPTTEVSLLELTADVSLSEPTAEMSLPEPTAEVSVSELALLSLVMLLAVLEAESTVLALPTVECISSFVPR